MTQYPWHEHIGVCRSTNKLLSKSTEKLLMYHDLVFVWFLGILTVDYPDQGQNGE